MINSNSIQEHGIGEYQIKLQADYHDPNHSYHLQTLICPDGYVYGPEEGLFWNMGIQASTDTGEGSFQITDGQWTRSYLFKA